jgi:hypothetical protein
MEEIARIPQIDLTTKLRTSSDQTGYMVVTSHYLDLNWKLVKCLIGFKPLPLPHTGPAITKCISQILLEWNAVKKCTFLTAENTSSNNVAVRQLLFNLNEGQICCGLDAGGAYFHLQCAAHFINVFLKDGLKVVNTGINKL